MVIRAIGDDQDRELSGHRVLGSCRVTPSETVACVVQQVARNVKEVVHEVPADDLDVPTFLRRKAQKA